MQASPLISASQERGLLLHPHPGSDDAHPSELTPRPPVRPGTHRPFTASAAALYVPPSAAALYVPRLPAQPDSAPRPATGFGAEARFEPSADAPAGPAVAAEPTRPLDSGECPTTENGFPSHFSAGRPKPLPVDRSNSRGRLDGWAAAPRDRCPLRERRANETPLRMQANSGVPSTDVRRSSLAPATTITALVFVNATAIAMSAP